MLEKFLEAEQVYLRPLKKSDLEGNYIAWLNDPETNKYNSHGVIPYTEEQALRYIEESRTFSKTLILAIIFKENNEHIGNISLQKIDFINQNAELAILMGEKQYRGKGLAKEAASLLIEHGFMKLNLHRIYCGTAADNIPMQKLAAHLGMKKEGLRRETIIRNGKYIDGVEYGFLKKEFFQSREEQL
jgi:[ribosomal protein S5]-alanine N-acetyltransferase